MWGLERLWPEGLLWGVGMTLALWERGRAYAIPLLFGAYGAGLLYEVGAGSALLEISWWAGRLGLIFSLLTAAAWTAYPPSREGALAVLLQLGAYALLLRSTHLTMTWALLETAAIAGYFVVITLSRQGNPWGTAIIYFAWNVIGSALILMAIALRLAEGKGLSYPLSSAGWLSDGLLGWGWAIKVGLLPWQAWLLRLYEALPPVWAGWFSAIPKGALLSNFLFMLPDSGEGGPQMGVFYFLSAGTLIGSYSIAWRQASPLRILFWGSLGQGAFLSLVLVPGAQVAGWYFWMVYAVGTWVSFVYAERPWLSDWGKAVGLLLLANLAALPPIVGFWVKVALFERGFQLLSGLWRYILLGSGAFALIGGLLSYGKALWLLWESPDAFSPPSRPYRALYLLAALAFLVLGIGVGLL